MSRNRLPDRGITTDSRCRDVTRIKPDDPATARLDSANFIGFEAAVERWSRLTPTGSTRIRRDFL